MPRYTSRRPVRRAYDRPFRLVPTVPMSRTSRAWLTYMEAKICELLPLHVLTQAVMDSLIYGTPIVAFSTKEGLKFDFNPLANPSPDMAG